MSVLTAQLYARGFREAVSLSCYDDVSNNVIFRYKNISSHFRESLVLGRPHSLEVSALPSAFLEFHLAWHFSNMENAQLPWRISRYSFLMLHKFVNFSHHSGGKHRVFPFLSFLFPPSMNYHSKQENRKTLDIPCFLNCQLIFLAPEKILSQYVS